MYGNNDRLKTHRSVTCKYKETNLYSCIALTFFSKRPCETFAWLKNEQGAGVVVVVVCVCMRARMCACVKGFVCFSNMF